jgi:hypothetical protein
VYFRFAVVVLTVFCPCSITMPNDWEVQFNSSMRTVKGTDAPAYKYNATAKAACEYVIEHAVDLSAAAASPGNGYRVRQYSLHVE